MSDLVFFFFKQKTAYEIASCLVGSEMCIRDRRQFGHAFFGQNDQVVKAMDCKSIGLCTRGIESHLFRFFNWFYGGIDSNLQFEYINSSSNLGKKLVT